MNTTSILMFIVFVGMVFFAVGGISNDLNSHYSNGTEINTSFWDNKYNYTERINSSIQPLITDFQNIQDEEKGWFTRLVSGSIAIPHAIISFATLSFFSVTTMNDIIIDVGSFLHLPIYIIYSIIVILVVFMISKLISFFRGVSG